MAVLGLVYGYLLLSRADLMEFVALAMIWRFAATPAKLFEELPVEERSSPNSTLSTTSRGIRSRERCLVLVAA